MDFCQEKPKQLFPISLSLPYPDSAVKETLRVRKAGSISVYLHPDLASRLDKHFDDPVFSRFRETVEELEMPVAFHVVVREQPAFHEWIRRLDSRPGPLGLYS